MDSESVSEDSEQKKSSVSFSKLKNKVLIFKNIIPMNNLRQSECSPHVLKWVLKLLISNFATPIRKWALKLLR